VSEYQASHKHHNGDDNDHNLSYHKADYTLILGTQLARRDIIQQDNMLVFTECLQFHSN